MKTAKGVLEKSISGSLILSGITAIQFALSFITQIVLARTISPESFGIAAFAVAVSFFFVTASSLSGDKFYLREAEDNQLNSIISVEIIVSLGVFVFASVLLPVVLDAIGKSGHLIYCQALLLLCFYNPLSRPRVIYEKKLEFYKAKKSFFIAQVVSCFLAMSSAYLGAGVWSIILWRFSALFFEIIFIYYFFPFKFKFSLPDFTYFKRLYHFGWPLMIAALSVYFYGNVDYYIVSSFLSPIDLGYYWLAYQFMNQLLQARKIIVSIASPALINLSDKVLVEQAIEKVTKVLIWGYSIPFFAFFVFDQALVQWLFGEKWLPATNIFIIFSSVIILRVATTMFEPFCIKFNKTKPLMNITLLSSGLMVFFGLILTPLFGIEGMSLAVIVTTIITTGLCFFVMLSEVSISFFKCAFIPISFIISSSFLFKIFFEFLKESHMFWPFFNVFFVCLAYSLFVYFIERKQIRELYNQMKRIIKKHDNKR